MGQSEIALAGSLATITVLFAVLSSAARSARSNQRSIGNPAVGEHRAGPKSQTGSAHVQPVAVIGAGLRQLASEVEVALPQQIRWIDQRIDDTNREIARLHRQIASSSFVTIGTARREPDLLTGDADVLPIVSGSIRRSKPPAVESLEDRRLRRAA